MLRATNPDKVREKSLASYYKFRDERLAYAKSPAGKAVKSRYKAKRRTAELSGNLSGADLARVFDAFGGLCAYCRSGGDMQIDHFNPLRRGGSHSVGNIVISCGKCNNSKNARDPFDWMEARGVDSDFVIATMHETRS